MILVFETFCSSHWIVAFVTLLCYDYFLTFGREVSPLIDDKRVRCI